MAGHRLLVVEGDTASPGAYRRFYSRAGWDVRVAGTPAEALRRPDEEPAPRVLMLRVGYGAAVLERIRAKGRRTRVAVCTGTVSHARLRASEFGPGGMLPRSVNPPEEWTEPRHVCAARTD